MDEEEYLLPAVILSLPTEVSLAAVLMGMERAAAVDEEEHLLLAVVLVVAADAEEYLDEE